MYCCGLVTSCYIIIIIIVCVKYLGTCSKNIISLIQSLSPSIIDPVAVAEIRQTAFSLIINVVLYGCGFGDDVIVYRSYSSSDPLSM